MKPVACLFLTGVLLWNPPLWAGGLMLVGMPPQAILVDEVLRQQRGGEIEALARYVASTTVRVHLEVLERDRHGVVILDPAAGSPRTDTMFCSGTIAGRRRIVLAAHCFDGELAYAVLKYPVTVYFGPDVDKARESGLVRHMIHRAIQPEYVQSLHRGSDAAMIELDDDVPAGFYAATPLTSLAELLDNASNLKVYLAGIGATRKGDLPDARARFGEVGIRDGVASIREDQDVLVTVPLSRLRKDRLASCGGDSGGQMFALMRGEIRWVGTTVSGNCASWTVSTVMTVDRVKALESLLGQPGDPR